MRKISKTEFIYKANKLHNFFYDYSNVEYTKTSGKVNIKCPVHGLFLIRVSAHLDGQGCKQCAYDKKQSSTPKFIKKANLVHGHLYDYSIVQYTKNYEKVKIICNIHGIFEQTPNNHLHGYGCPACAGKKKLTTTEFIKRATKVHGKKYEYSFSKYINKDIKVVIICDIHGSFIQSPHNHVFLKQGCPRCKKTPFSKKAIKWLKYISNKEYVFIQHAENIGEYTIPNTNYKVDGFCSENNTIYEFYGDAFHGNLSRYDANDFCHPYDRTITAQTLYNKTIEREYHLKQLGYKIITIWESDFDKIIEEIT